MSLSLALFVAACASSGDSIDDGFAEWRLLDDKELAETVFECIQAQGFEGNLIHDAQGSGTEFNVSDESEAVFDQTQGICVHRLVSEGLMRPTTRPTENELRARYDYLLGAADCLKANGVDTPDPPSLELYLDSGGFAWVPHAAALDQVVDNAELNKVLTTCPQL